MVNWIKKWIDNFKTTHTKFFVSIVAALGALLSQGLIPAQYASWVTALILIAGAFGVKQVTNDPAV